MDRLLRLLAVGIVVVVVLIVAVKLMMPRCGNFPTVVIHPQVPTPTPITPQPEDPCAQTVVLSLRSHAGAFAQMSVRNLDGQDMGSEKTCDADGQFAKVAPSLSRVLWETGWVF